MPACALSDLGWRVTIGSGRDEHPAGTSIAIAVKPLQDRDGEWVRRAAGAGVPTVLDLCDNVFIDGYGGHGHEIAERFTGLSRLASVVTVSTDALREIVVSNTGAASNRVIVVPDIVETPALLARQAALLGQWRPWARLRQAWARRGRVRRANRPVLLWFGNHGARHGSFGLTDLLLIRDALAVASTRHRAELWVVSNHRERFEAIARELPIDCTYFEWAPTLVDSLLRSADVCLVPNSLDPFSVTKSPNRALKALHAGVPVVATPTRAYEGLETCTWLGDPTEGIEAFLEGGSVAQGHLREARRILERHYSMDALRAAMARVVQRSLDSAEPAEAA